MIRHVLTDYDTLKHLAQFYLGDSNRWQEIVDYNQLHYPYIVRTKEEKEDLLYGKGFVRIVRANTRSAVTIQPGWTFHTKPYLVGGHTKEFVVTEPITIPAGERVGIIPIRATIRGHYGNVSNGDITVPGEAFAKNGVVLTECYNDQPLTGGQDINILATGEILYIPSERDELPPEDMQKLLDILGGEDLHINQEGELYADGFGDIASISGVDNIVQAINDRLMTERGDLPLHPEYGTNIPELIGSAQTPYTAKLVELDIYDALSYEDRIRDVQIQDLVLNGSSVEVILTFRIAEIDREVTQQLMLDYYERLPQ